MKLVPVDHDPFADAAPASAGPRLVPVDHDPFADPATVSDLPTAGLPGDGTAAIGRGIINGVPVAGPYLLAGVNRAAAAVRALKNDTTFSDELGKVERFGEATAKANPWATTGGEIAGGVAGTIPLVMAAPAAFGAGAGSLLARTAASTASGAVLGGADAAVRSDADANATGWGAGMGAGLGAAGPVAGRLIGKAITAVRGEAPGMGLVREMAHGMSEQDLVSAQFLREQGRALPGGGAELSVGEALNAATGGRATRALQLERVAANSGGEGGRIAAEFYAARPAAVDNVARSAFDSIGPQNQAPSGVGIDLQSAARAGVRQTPEGIALAQAREAVGPRLTADQAGRVIQPEMRGVADAREAARKAQADPDYAAARAAPENIGIERTIAVERPGEPIVTPTAWERPQFTPDAPRPLGGMNASAPSADGPVESLARYIARKGGINFDGGEARANDFQRWNIPGVGNVARADGRSIDNFWREELIGAGYLKPDIDGGAARDIRDELLRKLTNEQRGVPSYQIGKEPSAARVRATRQADEYRGSTEAAEGFLDRDLINAGIRPETVHPDIRSRVLGEMMRDPRADSLDVYEKVVMAMRDAPPPTVKGTTIREEIPDVRFGQVNPQAALDAIGAQMRTAKGDVRNALARARRDLYGPDGQTDLSVEGLLHARERLDTGIKLALRDGDGTKVRDLQTARSALDGQLKTVPEVATADANFAANSRSLEPFEGNSPLARVVQQDPATGRMATPTEQVPSHLQGASAAREFLANATPAARQAYEANVATRILDAATDRRGNVDADKLSALLRESTDVLENMPDVYHRLDGVVRTRDALAKVEASPLGRIAARPDVDAAIQAVFTPNPKPGSHAEVSAAMTALARNRPAAARDLARIHLESVFNEATQQSKGVAAQYGGAGFASAVRGNSQQRHNLEAAIRALPEGDTLWGGLDRLMTTLEATGYRPQKGSDTAFNEAIKKQFASGSTPIGQAVSDVATGAAAGATVGGFGGAAGGAIVGLKRGAGDAALRVRMLGNGEAIARLMFDPRALPDLRALSRSPAGSKNAELFTRRLLALANGGGGPVREPSTERR
ncbi:hypothetical protein ASG40_13015 [Methylobacterium sp. Leaf399]|uniref:hypothetical protein n=1 Tax=unclassified Methylobacterium TaxID=2615210 RepID=UPI000700D94C|nr:MULTISPECIES: hypothetical protein [unclassified Methylobacterium]KQP50841.1 hypothetical protein ASF39_11395 [Methylobacterium sp. Leaf108]KQT07822.1 hypothetical protein ASG40_13015 [Methylobacterium sp. Leaf399]